MMRTAEDICVDYALCVQSVRVQRNILRDTFCENYEAGEPADYASNYPGMSGTSKNDCVDTYNTMSAVGAVPANSTYYDQQMCPNCKIRLEAYKQMKWDKQRLSRVKRIIESMGNKINKTGGTK